MIEALHDEIDALEELTEAARKAVADVRPLLADAVEETGDVTKALELIAALVEDRLASLTTQAVRVGASFAKARAQG